MIELHFRLNNTELWLNFIPDYWYKPISILDKAKEAVSTEAASFK